MTLRAGSRGAKPEVRGMDSIGTLLPDDAGYLFPIVHAVPVQLSLVTLPRPAVTTRVP